MTPLSFTTPSGAVRPSRESLEALRIADVATLQVPPTPCETTTARRMVRMES